MLYMKIINIKIIKKNHNYIINNNAISTNSSSVNKNINYRDSIPQLNDTNSENNKKNKLEDLIRIIQK